VVWYYQVATRYGSDPRRMPFDYPDVLAIIAPWPAPGLCPIATSQHSAVTLHRFSDHIRWLSF
jgi:hypothetical protein